MLIPYIEAQRFRWFVFTAFFGFLPIMMRVAFSLSNPGKDIPLILLSDVAFLGLMFNASALANITSYRYGTHIYTAVIGVAVITSSLLAMVYAIDVVHFSVHPLFWIIPVTLVLTTCVLSLDLLPNPFMLSLR